MKNNNYFGGTSLTWGEYNFDKNNYATIPPAQLNGGLFTGEPFKQNAPYRNFPVVPDEGYMTNINLKSANPPPGATTQYNNIRPGNNYHSSIGVQLYNEKNYNFTCPPNK
jgi:hypothetical protein